MEAAVFILFKKTPVLKPCSIQFRLQWIEASASSTGELPRPG